ncbi:hypothetical protein DLJ53_23025 [Acuticoccus sediminis]|uniref:Lipoprotein n=1 Tax=Acuticoccus sediminis TaxID=2184697 RepID=A0A8B2NQD4_9HYPH|nr:hypothetical protein [Acuticoccus sediminis]RAH99402.1 hypothetical protein DLJ53_23025 [Acuticoccus sediminis]
MPCLRIIAAAPLCLVLVGCNTADLGLFKAKEPEAVYVEVPIYIKGPPTAWQKEAIIGYVRNEFRDPYSIRDAEISAYGMQAESSTRERTIVCVQLNAKNGYGGYAGRQIVQFELGPRSVRSASEDHAQCTEMNGRGLSYQPFPELENLGRL